MNTDKVINDLKGKKPKRVLFVCLGNICRSPAAEGIMRDVVARHGQTVAGEESDLTDKDKDAADWVIDSAGTGGWHVGDLPDRRMRIHARRRGYELTHICRQVNPMDFYNFDLIIGMDSQNVRTLKQMAPTVEAEAKVMPMGMFLDPGMGFDYVPDPYYEGADGFERVLTLLEDGCERLYQELK